MQERGIEGIQVTREEARVAIGRGVFELDPHAGSMLWKEAGLRGETYIHPVHGTRHFYSFNAACSDPLLRLFLRSHDAEHGEGVRVQD